MRFFRNLYFFWHYYPFSVGAIWVICRAGSARTDRLLKEMRNALSALPETVPHDIISPEKTETKLPALKRPERGSLYDREQNMIDLKDTCRLALIQAEPVLFDKKACTAKALKYVEQAKEKNAELIVFPELFIPGYPIGMNFGFSMGKRTEEGRADWKRYYDASMVVGEPCWEQLRQAAADAGAYVSIGFSERDAVIGTLYNSNVIFAPDGTWNVHRKLKPTGTERVVWGDADRAFFPVTETPWGNVGSLICWESYMPLARVALYEKGITIYISPNTNDNPEWQATIRHIAIEGKCYFINSDMLVRRSSYPEDLKTGADLASLPDLVCRGGSCIVDPYGHYVTEPVWDREEMIVADLDMQLPAACRMEHDAAGHYSRPDVLELIVHEN